MIFVGLLLTLSALGSPQAPWDAQALMENLASVREVKSTFTESRTSGFLITDIQLSGKLHYRAPDFIRKIVETPYEQITTINGDNVSIEKINARGESTTRHYSLGAHESLQSTVEGIRATLSGNYEYLQESFEIEVSGNRESWSVLLLPRNDVIGQQIESILIMGMGGRISSIDTTNTDGDKSRLRLFYQSTR